MIVKTPVPIKKKKSNSTVDDLILKFSASMGKEPVPVARQSDSLPKAPAPVRKTDVNTRLLTALGRACAPACEICRAKTASMFRARCNHFTWLCPECHRTCKIAMIRCDKCDAKYTAKQLASVENACIPVAIGG